MQAALEQRISYLNPHLRLGGHRFFSSHVSSSSRLGPQPSTSSTMPARTLSPLVAADPATLSPAHHRLSSPPYRRRDSNGHERRASAQLHGLYIPFDVPPNQHAGVAHMGHHPALTNHNYTGSHPSFFQPLQRVYPSHTHWSTPSLPLPQSPPSLGTGWLPHPPPMPSMPSYTPPPQILHKVWILDCQSCGNFLTNRGMKVCYIAFVRARVVKTLRLSRGMSECG